MKRSVVSNDGPRRSKRLAKTSKTSAGRAPEEDNNDDAKDDSVPSVVSLSNDSSRRPMRIPYLKFPQGLMVQVEETLSSVTQFLANESNECSEIYTIYQKKEPMLRILKFALSDKAFLALDETSRTSQGLLVNDLCWEAPMVESSNALGHVGTLVEVLITRGDIVPPKSISFLHSDNLEHEVASYMETSSSLTEEESFNTCFKEMLCNKGNETVRSIESLLCIIESLFHYDPEKAKQASSLLVVLKNIVQFWVQVLEEAKWDASQDMRYEQLENVNSAFDFAQKFQMDTKTIDVKTLLLKLVLYFAFAIEWPRENNWTDKERNELKRLAKIVRC